jgi:HSP20 family protein
MAPRAAAKSPAFPDRSPGRRWRDPGCRGFPTFIGGDMQLTRWNPFAELDEMQQRLNRLLADRSAKGTDTGFADFRPAVDVQETDAEFLVKVDLPDVKKEDIKIQMVNGVLTIEGERRKEQEETGKRFHKVEREYGRFVRRFELPSEVDAGKVRAAFKHGVLNVALPKAAIAKPAPIEITVG